MFRFIKTLFVPMRSNDFEPHLLRVWPVTILLAVILIFFGAAQLAIQNLKASDGFLAAVVASVLVDLTNFDRAEAELHSLSVNPTLAEAARLKAEDMAAKGYFSHNSPDGETPWYWFNKAGYDFAYAGENLAVFFGDSKDVERAWMNSPAHRANILNSHFTEIGIATAVGYYQGQQTTFVVQMFGTPARLAPFATVSAEPVAGQSEIPTGIVSGESVQQITEETSMPASGAAREEINIIHEDETFIAVRSDAAPAPSTQEVALQSTLVERLVASPRTLLSFAYTFLSAVVGIALILLIFLEMTVQKPKNVALAFLLLFAMTGLFYFSHTEVVVAAGGEGFSQAINSRS